MKFDLANTIEIIERTPSVLNAMLQGISDGWVYNNEGENTWSVFDVIGHLIVCEKTDFIPRAAIILSDSENRTIDPIDMDAHFEWGKGKDVSELLQEFEMLRKANIHKLVAMNLTENDFQKTAVHPKIGQLTLGHLLATWVAHDLSHISQITRVMAKQYKDGVGGFIQFMSVLK
jgi:hypothetical protein